MGKMKTQSDLKDRFVIIMAGGRGERFWPLSREKMPKQLLALLGKKSFLQEAVERVLPLVPVKNIFVITNEAQLPEVRKQLPKIPKANLIAEPIGRDTCAAVTLGAALVGARSTTGVMAVLPADHVIPDEKKFQQVLCDAFDLARAGQAIVTIGIKPTEPATGYGYIHVGQELPHAAGREENEDDFFQGGTICREAEFRDARWNTSTAASIAGTRGCSSGVSSRSRTGWRSISRRCSPRASAGSRWRTIRRSSRRFWRRNIPASKKSRLITR